MHGWTGGVGRSGHAAPLDAITQSVLLAAHVQLRHPAAVAGRLHHRRAPGREAPAPGRGPPHRRDGREGEGGAAGPEEQRGN
jgi:hypothetical protein